MCSPVTHTSSLQTAIPNFAIFCWAVCLSLWHWCSLLVCSGPFIFAWISVVSYPVCAYFFSLVFDLLCHKSQCDQYFSFCCEVSLLRRISTHQCQTYSLLYRNDFRIPYAFTFKSLINISGIHLYVWYEVGM